MEIHERIKAIREAKRISQSEMSEHLGMATQNYWKIEKGKTELTVSRLYQISKTLNVSVLDILNEKDKYIEERENEYRVLLSNASKDKFTYMNHVHKCYESLNLLLEREIGFSFLDLQETNEEAEKAIANYINDGKRLLLFYLLGFGYFPSEIEYVLQYLLKILAPFTDSEKLLLVNLERNIEEKQFFREFLSSNNLRDELI